MRDGEKRPLELCSLCFAKNLMRIGARVIKAQIIKHYQHLADREAFVTAEMVRRSALATLCLQRIPIRALVVSMRRC